MAWQSEALRYNRGAMHARRFACLILGLWLGGAIFMAWVATQNFREVDRLLDQASPAARLELKALGPNARTLLRYHAAEENRWYFRAWETGQIILGTGFLLVMLFGSRENQFTLGGIVLLILIVAVQRFFLTPEITAQGRVLDFMAPDAGLPDRNRFWVLHSAYAGVEVGKWVLMLVLGGKMIFSRQRSGRSRDSRRELDMVNKPDYGRVNW
jgi:hypothetical protein